MFVPVIIAGIAAGVAIKNLLDENARLSVENVNLKIDLELECANREQAEFNAMRKSEAMKNAQQALLSDENDAAIKAFNFLNS